MLKKMNKILSRKQKASFVLMAILLFVGGLFDLLGVSLILPVIDSVTNENAVANEDWAVIVSDLFNINNARDIVIFLVAVMIFVYIIKNLYMILMYRVLYHFTYGFKKELALRLFNCYMYQDYTFHLSKNVADLQRNILTDTGQFYGFISDFMNMFSQCIVCILLGIYLFVVDWQTTAGVVVLLGGAMFMIYHYQKRTQVKRGIANRESSAELNKWIIQSFSGIKEIQVLGRESYFLERCKEAYDKGMIANKRSNFAAVVPKLLMEMLCVSGLLSVILVRLLMGAELSKFVSTLAVFAVAAFRMLPCFNSISAYISSMLFEKNSVDVVYSDIVEMESLGEKRQHKKTDEKIKLKEKISVENLSYKYPDTTKLILENVSIEIKKNQSVGFMGASGAGKSTLIDIILGVLPISVGKICVDGNNICDNLDGWHKSIGYIPQSIYLMDDTIRNNVAFGLFREQISDDRLWEVLEEAQIADFVHSLPEGLDTEIGDHGVRISGGQRQRLGIARALYHDPEILIFDEATSALDNETEAALMEAINGLKGTRTMLIIAHRLHTIENCDVVYEVKDGKVEEKERIGEKYNEVKEY